MAQLPPDPQFERLPSGYVRRDVFLRDSTIQIPLLSAISTGVHSLSCQLSTGDFVERTNLLLATDTHGHQNPTVSLTVPVIDF